MREHTVSTGIGGLDDLLYGGLPKGSTIILEGTPGSGKTTLAFQFLYQGAMVDGDSGIYVTFEELPSQLYADMSQFGWDLRQLEKRNQLRVLCLSPETLMDQMQEPGGVFDQVVEEINCKRIVIDSVSLFQYGLHGDNEHRKVIYQLRNILRKKGLTALLVREQSEVNTSTMPFEHFVVDGVIRLTITRKSERYRERILEVMKMRGQPFLEGEHVYRITGKGIHVIPALHIFNNTMIEKSKKYLTTGIVRLDEILGGGILNGHVYMFDTNSKSETKHLFGSMVAAQIKQSKKTIILSSSLSTLYEKDALYHMHGANVQDMIDQNSLLFVEHYDRAYPPSFAPGVINVSKMDENQFNDFMHGILWKKNAEQGGSWFVYYDLNTLISERGVDFISRYFASEAANARTHGVTLMAVCNFNEIDESVASFLQRASDGVIRTWVDHAYQYLQVNKLPDGHVSDIQIVEHISYAPYIRLI